MLEQVPHLYQFWLKSHNIYIFFATQGDTFELVLSQAIATALGLLDNMVLKLSPAKPSQSVLASLQGSAVGSGSRASAAADLQKKASTPKIVVKKEVVAPKKISTHFRKVFKNYAKRPGTLKCKRDKCCKTPEQCARWGDYEVVRKKDGTEIHKPTGSACGDCDDVYWTSFELMGTRDEVLESCNEDDDVELMFSAALRVKLNKDHIKPFFSSDVGRTQATGVRGAIRKRGLTPDEFQEVFQKTPAEAGKTLTLLRHPETPGQLYQGVLIADHARLQYVGVLYELWMDVYVSETEVKLWHASQLRENQGQEVFDELTKPSGSEESDVKKMRLCNLTVDDVEGDAPVGKKDAEDAEADDSVGAGPYRWEGKLTLRWQ